MRNEQDYMIPEQAVDMYRYYITRAALDHGTMPHMEGMRVSEIVNQHQYEQGAVPTFGFVEYPKPLTAEQEKYYHLIPSGQNANYLQTAEMGMEQNLNQLDGLVNNEPPRSNQGYVILESEVIGYTEIVLAENKNAPQPFVTWQRNILNDKLDGGQENFFWGHYLGSEERAREDFGSRVKEKRDDFLDAHPSIRAQLKENAARCEKQSSAPAQKKDVQER